MKVVICGTSSTLPSIKHFDNSWVIYSANGATEQIDKFDKHFELHDIQYLRDLGTIPETYFDMMKKLGDKVVLNNIYDEFPEAEVYPINEACQLVGKKYFTNTAAYIIAYVLVKHKDLTDLALVGIDMAGDSEYAHQRPCCEFYLGMARGRGIEIHLPDSCPLTNASHLYGFEKLPANVVASKKMQKQLEQEIADAAALKVKADANFNHKTGQLAILKKMDRIYQ